MSFSARKTDSVVLKGIRALPSEVAEFYSEDYLQNEDKIRDRTCSTSHRGTFNSILPTPDSQSQELQTYTQVVPTVFVYDRDTVEEKCYDSIEDIPPIRSNQCLWIDVTGVSEK
jgi:hypothetical protein